MPVCNWTAQGSQGRRAGAHPECWSSTKARAPQVQITCSRTPPSRPSRHYASRDRDVRRRARAALPRRPPVPVVGRCDGRRGQESGRCLRSSPPLGYTSSVLTSVAIALVVDLRPIVAVRPLPGRTARSEPIYRLASRAAVVAGCPTPLTQRRACLARGRPASRILLFVRRAGKLSADRSAARSRATTSRGSAGARLRCLGGCPRGGSAPLRSPSPGGRRGSRRRGDRRWWGRAIGLVRPIAPRLER
jgi:hypothetical protein